MSIKRLLSMLKLCRAHDSKGEAVFVKKFLAPYAPEVFHDIAGVPLAYGVTVAGCENSHGSDVLWCAHVDTVHPKDAPLYQTIIYDTECQLIFKDDKDPLKMPLGADNAAGCWMLMEMIDAGVPGTYLFHRGEERGGIGSAGMAKNFPDFLRQFKYAIAFDRRGTCDVITEMMVGRTCSDVFAQSLGDKINARDNSLSYSPDNTGSFTDTANYIRLIPECTNVSVGYDFEHGPSEMLDVAHLVALRDAVVGAFKEGTGDLPVVRGVNDVEEYAKYSWGNWKDKNYGADDADAEFCLDPRDSTDIANMGYKEIVKWVRLSAPEDVADLLQTLADELEFGKQVFN